MHRFVLALLVALSILLPSSNAVSNSTYYVSSGGSGTACTALAPCSLSTGMNLLAAGDTLSVVGTIRQGVTLSKSGTPSARITLTGGTIDAPHSVQQSLLISGNFIDVRNIDITGGQSFGIRTKGHDITISRFNLHDTVWENRGSTSCIGGSGGWGSGFKFGPTSYNVEVYGGSVFDNCGEGMVISQSNHIYLHDLEVYDNFSRGIYVGNAPFVTVERAYVHNENRFFFRSGNPARGIGLAIETTNYSTYGNQLHDVIIRDNYIRNSLGTNFYSEVSGQFPSDVLIAGNTYENVPYPQIDVPGTRIIITGNVIVGSTLTPTLMFASRTPTSTKAPTRTKTPTPTLFPCPVGWDFDHADASYVYCRKAR